MTEEVLTVSITTMSDKKFIDKYAFIILDECHNRTSSMDITMFLLKKLISRNYRDPLCPFVILTSATIDVNKYGDYFGVNKENIITIKGFNYDIKEIFQETDVSNYIEKSAQIAMHIHHSNPEDYKGKLYDILIFVSSESDINKISKILEKNNSENNPYMVTILTSERYKKGESYRDIIKPIVSISITKNGKIIQPNRRIIIATNVAETGLTLDYLKYVIDTGYANQLLLDPIYGDNLFVKNTITRANAMQRRGRVGRVDDGLWYPMYTEQVFKNMDEDNLPDVIITDMTMIIFSLIVKNTIPDWDGFITNNVRTTGVFNIEEIDLIDDISTDSYAYSMEKLFVLGLIDSNYIPSPIGLSCTSFHNIELENILLILNGYIHECNIKDIITVAAFASIGVSRYMDIKNIKYNYTNISCGTFLYPYDDFIESIFIWDLFIEKITIETDVGIIQEWCITNGLIYEGLLNISAAIDEIIFILIQNIGLDPFYNGLQLSSTNYNLKNMMLNDPETGLQEIKKIKKCIHESYRFNIATWSDVSSEYIMNNTGKFITIDAHIFDIKDSPLEKPYTVTVGRKVMRSVKNNYILIGSNISVLNGYIEIDDSFIIS